MISDLYRNSKYDKCEKCNSKAIFTHGGLIVYNCGSIVCKTSGKHLSTLRCNLLEVKVKFKNLLREIYK